MSARSALELAERHAFEYWYGHARKIGPADFDWSLVRIGDALCSVSASEPSILMNRVFGLGSTEAPGTARLGEIRAAYAAAGVERFFLHLPPGGDAGLPAMLADAGFRRYRGWMKFTHDLHSLPEPATDLRIRAIGPRDAQAFAGIVAAAFDLLPDTVPVVATLVGSPGWTVFMSFADNEPAGTGAVFVSKGIGCIDWGATHPAFRRRGSQTALLAARLQACRDAGCTSAVTMTGEAVPGDTQQSYANILKTGFAEAYLRENWIPAAGG